MQLSLDGNRTRDRLNLTRTGAACCLLALSLGLSGCGLPDESREQSAVETPAPEEQNTADKVPEEHTPSSEPSKEEPPQVTKVAVQELLDGRFDGIVEVTGEVAAVFPNVIRLKSEDGKKSLTGNTKEPRPWEIISIGGTATLRGRPGFRTVNDSDIVATDGEPVPKFSAEEFLNVISEHLELTDRPFRDKQVLITGVVKATGVDVAGESRIHTLLLGLENVDLPIDGDGSAFETLKPGDTVTVLGYCDYVFVFGTLGVIRQAVMVSSESK
jgi:hypothetical protein